MMQYALNVHNGSKAPLWLPADIFVTTLERANDDLAILTSIPFGAMGTAPYGASPKNDFAERFQRDLGCPALLRKIYRFSRRANQ
jgi:hypothetical protein